MSASRDDRGGRAHDPERIADVREQLEAGSFRFTGENPADSSNAAADTVCWWCQGESKSPRCRLCGGLGHATSEDGGEAKCPWCGLVHGDMFELNLEDEETDEVECDCGETFIVTASVTYTLNARRKRGAADS